MMPLSDDLTLDQLKEMATGKEWAFCEQLLITTNGSKAAIASGYSAKSAKQAACRLMAKPLIQRILAELRSGREQRTKITQDRVLLEVGRIAFVDPRKAFDDNSVLLPVAQWPDEIAAAISSIKVLEVRDADGNLIGETKEIKFWSKSDALTLSARHLGMLNDKLTLDVTDNLADKLARARLRVEAEE